MADIDDLMGSLRNEGYLKGGSKTVDAAPSSSAADDSGEDQSWAPVRFGKGVLRGAAGEAVGAGQLASGLEEKVLGTHALSTIGEHIPGGEWLKEQTTRPSSGYWESAGNIVGSTLPWLLMPEVGAATRLGRILGAMPNWARGAASGAGIGAIQPTQSGTLESHAPGAILGAVGGGAVSGLGGKAASQAALKDFNKDALEAVVEPFDKHWISSTRPPLNEIGSKGVAEAQSLIDHMKTAVRNPRTPNKKQLTADITEAENRLDRFLDASTNHYVDPQSLLEHFNKPPHNRIPSHILKDLAEKGRRDGVPSLYPTSGGVSHAMSYPLSWLLRSAGLHFPHAGLHAGLNALARQSAGRSTMDELGLLARNAQRLRPYATTAVPVAAGQTASGWNDAQESQY
jgi:hypothetical protein